MKVLVACEFSGTVRDAFRRRGHDAVSCDFLPTEVAGPHIQADVLTVLRGGWDLMIAHPPCTYLSVSGIHWNSNPSSWRGQVSPGQTMTNGAIETERALDFVWALLHAPIPSIALENPVGVISSRIRPPDQIIQPWQFGHPESK